jgi:hypothetical protein
MVQGKDTSSSAGKVFAKPSKEWVLPERVKPRRKVSAEEPDNVSDTYVALHPLSSWTRPVLLLPCTISP